MKKNRFFLLIAIEVFFVLLLSAQAFAVEVILKTGKVLQANVINITDKDIKLDLNGIEMTYPLSEVKSVNGIEGISRTKLQGLRSQAFQYIDEAVGGSTIDGDKCDEGVKIIKQLSELNLSGISTDEDMVEVTKRCKKHDDSVPYIEKMIQKNSGSAKAHMELANVYRHHGYDKTMLPKAIAEYEKAVAIEGPTSQNQYEIGCTYWTFREWGKAIPSFKKALELNPNTGAAGDIYEYLGECYNNLDKPQEAIEAFQKALEFRSGNDRGLSYYGLGTAYAALGQADKADEYKRQADASGYHDRLTPR